VSTDLLSWAPDWRIPWPEELFEYLQLKFFASSYTRAEYQDQSDLGNLSVKAFLIDEVQELLNVTTEAWNLLYKNGDAVIVSNGKLENHTTLQGQPVFKPFIKENDHRRCSMLSQPLQIR
jgi:hypothetical protein